MTRKQKLKALGGLKLKRLAKQLKTPNLPSQESIAQAVGIDQPLVSRARNGELRRLTPRVDRLAKYVNMRIVEIRRSEAIVSGDKPVVGREDARVAALRTCREYLQHGCDPNALIDQVAILRRVQSYPPRPSIEDLA